MNRFTYFVAVLAFGAGCHVEIAKTPDAPPPPKPTLNGVTLAGAQIIAIGDIEYDKDLATIRDTKASRDVLEAILKIMNDNPMITKLRIESHTDSDGTAEHNEDLSQRRAAEVHSWLVNKGINSARIDAFGCGSRDPLVPNTSPENKQRNRRTEFDLEELEGKAADMLTAKCEPNPHRK